MLKHLLLSIAFLLLAVSLHAQVAQYDTSLYVIAPAGGLTTIGKNEKIQIAWTFGETFAYDSLSLDNKDFRVTAGMHQDEPVLFEIPASEDPKPISLVITPNGDGNNDEFIIVENILHDYPDNELFITNRWGALVFHQRPYDNSWTGENAHDNKLPADTYYFLLYLRNAYGTTLQGSVTIRR